MKTPDKIDIIAYHQELAAWQDKHKDESTPGLCKRCGGNLYMQRAYVSVHDATLVDFCSGFGSVLIFHVPFCPRCEEKPADRGCVHLWTCPEPLPPYHAPSKQTELLK